MELPDATREMVKFIAEKNAENNERSQRRDKTLKRLRSQRDKISTAIVGMGNALKTLTDKAAETEEELVSQEKELAYEDPNKAFLSKFGISMYSVNQNPKLSQK